MEIFFAESSIDYKSYTFPYGVYCLAESQYEFPQIYDQGFLPYTDRLKLNQSVFYKARSLRVNLNKLSSTSENRRTDRKMEDLNMETEWISIEEFNIQDTHFRELCDRYTGERFKKGEMSSDRLDYILNHDLTTQIWQCSTDGNPIGYVIIADHDQMLHYWFAFMSLDYLYDVPLGKWMMWNVLKESAESGYDYCYLGTVYGKNSLYKVRDHEGIEFYDGRGWNDDKKLLKKMCKNDENRGVKDAFKKSDNPQDFITLHS